MKPCTLMDNIAHVWLHFRWYHASGVYIFNSEHISVTLLHFSNIYNKNSSIATSSASALLCAASEVMKAGLPARSACRQQVHLPLRWAPGWKEGSMRSLQMLAFLIADSHWFSSFTFCLGIKKNTCYQKSNQTKPLLFLYAWSKRSFLKLMYQWNNKQFKSFSFSKRKPLSSVFYLILTQYRLIFALLTAFGLSAN